MCISQNPINETLTGAGVKAAVDERRPIPISATIECARKRICVQLCRLLKTAGYSRQYALSVKHFYRFSRMLRNKNPIFLQIFTGGIIDLNEITPLHGKF